MKQIKKIRNWMKHTFFFFGLFWYSEKQDQQMQQLQCMPGGYHENYARQLFTGKVVRYTEWTNINQRSRWDDAKLVAIGFVYHKR